ncbi:MAG: COX15/CtaA family protein [Lysobacteraceae bacterium]
MNHPAANSPHRLYHRIGWIAVLLALVVIVFGAFVRLSNAGLSCPDWPTCYGRVTWPVHDHEIAHANDAFDRPVESHKAWREQVHRHLAATLGLMVFALAFLGSRKVRGGKALVIGASLLVAMGIPLYMRGHHAAAASLAIAGEVLLLGWALRPDGWLSPRGDFSRLSAALLAVIVFQALLGMWTVTWLLKPVVVMGHLLGGLTTLSLLTWLACRASPLAALHCAPAWKLRGAIVLGIGLVAIQIALGGWVSANYAALACGTDFPTCLNQWLPQTNFREAFVLWRGIGADYEGGVLDGPARVAIQLSHRGFAVIVAGALIWLGLKIRRIPEISGWGTAILTFLGVQVLLGILNVKTGLPLKIAVSHNAVAALLLFTLVLLLARLRKA